MCFLSFDSVSPLFSISASTGFLKGVERLRPRFYFHLSSSGWFRVGCSKLSKRSIPEKFSKVKYFFNFFKKKFHHSAEQ